MDNNDISQLLHRIHIGNDIKQIIEEDFISKLEEKQRTVCYPKWAKVRNTSEARLIKEQRELIYIEKDLEQKLNELKSQRKTLDLQWKELEDKQKELHDSFIKFDTFIKDNQEIQKRSRLQIAKEIERQERIKLDIEQLNEQVNYYKKAKNIMEENVEKYSIYSEFLERIINETSSFKSIQDIFNNFDNLVEATKVLTENLDSKEQMLKTIEDKRHDMIQAKSENLIDLNKNLAKLQEKYDTLEEYVDEWETKVSYVRDLVAEKKLELIRVQASCWNMYEQICKEDGIDLKKSPEDHKNVQKQFEYIKNAIAKKKEILEHVKKRIEINFKTLKNK